jgi:hypothetical protein
LLGEFKQLITGVPTRHQNGVNVEKVPRLSTREKSGHLALTIARAS